MSHEPPSVCLPAWERCFRADVGPCLCAAASRRVTRRDACHNLVSATTTAVQIMERQGFDVSMEQIAQEAGVGIATFYRAFGDRAVLMLCVMAERFSLYEDYIRELRADGQADPGARFDGLFMRMVRSARLSTLSYFLAHRHEHDTVPDLYRSLVVWMEEEFEVFIREAQEAGVVRPGITFLDLSFVVTACARTPTGLTPQETEVMVRRQAALGLSSMRLQPVDLPEEILELTSLVDWPARAGEEEGRPGGSDGRPVGRDGAGPVSRAAGSSRHRGGERAYR